MSKERSRGGWLASMASQASQEAESSRRSAQAAVRSTDDADRMRDAAADLSAYAADQLREEEGS